MAVPRTAAELQALLDNSDRMNVQTTPCMGQASADEYFVPEEVFANFDQQQQQLYTWQLQEYTFQNDWSVAYEPVYVANFCLEGATQLGPVEANAAAAIRGAALFYRSYNFLQLLWNYAHAYEEMTASSDLGIVLRLDADFNKPSVRSSVADGYAQVLSDTRDAALLLPETVTPVTRPCKGAAYALLARTFWSMRQYDSALVYARQALAINNRLINFNHDEDLVGIQETVPFRRLNKETLFYSDMQTTLHTSHPARARVDTLLYAQYHEHDLRKIAYFLPNENFFQFKGHYTGHPTRYFTGLATDEMYLIAAEGLARSGNVNEAMDLLNALLITRWDETVPYEPLTALNSEDALNIVLLERRKSLYGRGLRWIDIKRLNKEGRGITQTRHVGGRTYTLEANSAYYALPLPADIIEQTGIPQN